MWIIELYWEPTIPECGVWDRSDNFPGEYTEEQADEILRNNLLAYRKTKVS